MTRTVTVTISHQALFWSIWQCLLNQTRPNSFPETARAYSVRTAQASRIVLQIFSLLSSSTSTGAGDYTNECDALYSRYRPLRVQPHCQRSIRVAHLNLRSVADDGCDATILWGPDAREDGTVGSGAMLEGGLHVHRSSCERPGKESSSNRRGCIAWSISSLVFDWSRK